MSRERIEIRKAAVSILKQISPDIKVFDTPVTNLQDADYPALRVYVKNEIIDDLNEQPYAVKRKVYLTVECHVGGTEGTEVADMRDVLMHLVEEKMFQSDRLNGTVEKLTLSSPNFLQNSDGIVVAHAADVNFVCLHATDHPRESDLVLEDFLRFRADFDTHVKDEKIEISTEKNVRGV